MVKNCKIIIPEKIGKAVLIFALELSYNNWVDELYSVNNPTYIRKHSDKTFEEALELIDGAKPYYTCYFRNDKYFNSMNIDYWELGVNNIGTLKEGVFFIYILLEDEKFKKVVDKFNLKYNWY
jgi:hypothetical protein